MIAIIVTAALDAFRATTAPGERFAPDWQHAAFLFNPRKPEDMQAAQIILPAWAQMTVRPASAADGMNRV